MFWAIGGIIAAPPARAQFLTPRPQLSGTSFWDTPETRILGGVSPFALLEPTLWPDAKTANRLFGFGAVRETVRTVKGGVHTGDLFGSGGGAYAVYRLPRRVPLTLEFFAQTGTQTGLIADPSKNERTDARFRPRETALRLTYRPAYKRIKASFPIADADASISGNSTGLTGLLPLFSDTSPRATVRVHSREIGATVAYPLRQAAVEGTVFQQNAPDEAVLDGNDTQVRLPLNRTGWGQKLTVRGPFAARTGEAAAWAGRVGSSGTGNVWGGGETLGKGAASQHESTIGIAARWNLRGPASRLNAQYDAHFSTYEVRASGLLALPLGFSPDTVNRVGYNVGVRTTRRTMGVGWDKETAPGQHLTLRYRFVWLPVHADYHYSGRLFLLSLGDGGAYDVPDARGHLLRVGCDLPLSRRTSPRAPRLFADLTQVIPLPLARKKSTSPSPPTPPASNGPRTRTRGGWNAALGVSVPL